MRREAATINSTRAGGLRSGRILLASSFIFVAFLLAAISLATGASSGWSIVASPNAIGGVGSQLNGVTCTSATNCWAVGVYYSGVFGQTLIEQWNGSSWAIVPSPNNTTQSNGLNGVTCISDSECWAVGYFYDTTDGGLQSLGLIEQWDGTSWTITAVNGLPAEANYNYFQSVTCPSASECWAVGYSLYSTGGLNDLGFSRTLIAQWNGSAWTVVLSPNTNALGGNLLNSVTCTSATNCWAVGYSYGPNDPRVYQSLIEQWNGISWTIVPSPTVNGSTSNELRNVTCASTTDCWAVGVYVNPFETALTLIEHWNGSSWVVVASPNAITNQNNVLNAVTCASASECWAVGYYGPMTNASETLIEQWNGTAWSIVASPNAIAEYNSLNGVICNSASNCWAVGYYYEQYFQTLIENYAGTSPSPTPTPTPTATPLPTVSTPTISPSGGTFNKKVKVKISCATAGATIYYTLDGNDPTTASAIYSKNKKFKGIKLKGKGLHTVKAMAAASGFNNSTMASATFTIN